MPILNNSISGLRAFQSALSTVSQNISNVETEGYSRQRVEFSNRNPTKLGDVFFGQGVGVSDIDRIIDEFVVGNIREFSSTFNRLDMMDNFASRLENLIADEQGSLLPSMDGFFNAVNDVANDPASTAPRTVMLSQAENLQARFNSLATEMQKLDEEVDNRISFEVSDINGIITEIARINDSIQRISSADKQPADLLDKRDVLLKKLSEKISVSVVEQVDGTLNVLVGTGQLLVTGAFATKLETVPENSQPDRLGISLVSSGGRVDITSNVTGGSLGGLLDYRNNVLDPAQNSLGRTAMVLADSFNAQQNNGYDLNGNLGANFFTVGAPQVLSASSNNPATGLPDVTISDANALTTSDYRADFAGGNYTITRLSDNAIVAGPAAGPVFTGVDGIDFDFTGAGAVAGDSFRIRPTRLGAIDFQNLISDTNQIAAASPLRANSSTGNLGDADISNDVVVDNSNVDLLNTVTVTFNSPAGTFDVFDVTNGAVLATGVVYTDGMTISYNGWQARLSGSPEAGDILTVEENTGAASDNRNALLLADLSSQKLFDGGTATYEQSYSAMTSSVGAVTQQIKINRDVEDSLLTSSISERESISGVNLDEEAANLIKFQQAYQAAARAVQTAQQIFQTLLDAT